jgi:hypothetical protein
LDAPTLIPFYLDWKFWSFLVSGVAVLLSQLPPVKILIRPKNLEVEVHSRINVTHQVGNPNVGLHVSLDNSGGRDLRIKGLLLNIEKDGKKLVTLPAQSYFESATDKTSVLFVPFTLKPEEYWSHSVNFLNHFDRATEKSYRDSTTSLKLDLQGKFKERAENDKKNVVGDTKLVIPFTELFNKLFAWEPGEYIFELVVDSLPSSSTFSKKYRFTLFESDTRELKALTNDYQFGGGLIYNVESHIGLFIAISEHHG